jgi:hypothetical protein
MESSSEENRIHCSEAAALLVMEDPDIVLNFRGQTVIKGKGNMPTYWVERLRCEGESSLDPRAPPIIFRSVKTTALNDAACQVPIVAGTAQGCKD